MQWLVTTAGNTDLQVLIGILRKLDCTVADDAAPVPLDRDEKVLEVEGPADLPQRAAPVPEIHGVYPSSELTLYDSDRQ